MKPRLLIAHPWMSRGGSEATAMWTLQALVEDHDLTFVTAAPLGAEDWDALNRTYGTSVDPARLRIVQAPALPGVNGPRRLVHLQVRRFERFCNELAPGFDLAISTYNPIYFGIPAIHLIGDFSFDEGMRRRLTATRTEPARHRPGPLRSAYLAAGRWLEIERPPLREWGGRILANSTWAAAQLEQHFRLERPGVLHPPVPLSFASAAPARDPHGCVCLGRIVPEKEIERIIDIVARVRSEGFPLVLTIAGPFDESDYSRGLRDRIDAAGDWIRTPGFLDLAQKRALLETQTFAIHACRIEAFGIAVAEMVAMGCVPVVPEEGGAGDIVTDPSLRYTSEDEAVAILRGLLHDPARVRRLSAELPAGMARFSPESFVRRLRESVLGFLPQPESRNHEAHPENLHAAH